MNNLMEQGAMIEASNHAGWEVQILVEGGEWTNYLTDIYGKPKVIPLRAQAIRLLNMVPHQDGSEFRVYESLKENQHGK